MYTCMHVIQYTCTESIIRCAATIIVAAAQVYRARVTIAYSRVKRVRYMHVAEKTSIIDGKQLEYT